jgi:putative CocE/NonD family hydrolase
MKIGRTLWNRRIRLRDGVELAADVLLPMGAGPFPAVVLRTPYLRGRHLNNSNSWPRLVDYGYALVTVDMRGRNDSDGTWLPRVKDPEDGYDVVEWVAAQPWCTGRIGMVGGSYEGLTQWWTALHRPPHLACIAPLAIGHTSQQRSNFGTGIPSQYRMWWLSLVNGRTLQYSGAPSWEAHVMHTPLKTLDEQYGLSRSAWRKYVAGEIDFPGKAGSLSEEDYAAIDIPVLIGVGWWDDQDAMLTWQALQRARSARNCRLLIGAWDHLGNIGPRPILGGIDVSASVMDTIGYVEQFLAVHLKGDRGQAEKQPRCRVFLTGEDRWELLDDWPHPQATVTPLYLTSGGDARSLKGNGRLVSRACMGNGSDTYVFDPNDPARDMSNLALFAWADPPLDCRYMQRRKDALVYTSDPLAEPLKVSGRYHLRIFVSSDRPDTDVFVNLSDVHPDGRAISLVATNMLIGALRLRYRNGCREELLTPGEIYEVTVTGSWLHHVFRAGHRLRITINSSGFPLAVRNAGAGGHWAEDRVLYPQTNTIHHGSRYPSRVLLPVVPRELC